MANSKDKALKTMKEVKSHIKQKKSETKKTGWEESGTGSRYIPKIYR